MDKATRILPIPLTSASYPESMDDLLDTISFDPVQTPISLDKGHIVSYISAKCETQQMYVFI